MSGYAFRAAGTVSATTGTTDLTPGAPAGKQVGDLLIFSTAHRVTALSITSLSPGWTQLFAGNSGAPSVEVWARIADGSATDTPTVTWSASGFKLGWIEAYSGDVYTDLATIVAHTNNVQGGSLSSIVVPTLTVTTDNTLLYCFGAKVKTATSNDATTLTTNAGSPSLVQRQQSFTSGNALMAASGSAIETTATSYDGADFTRDGTDESANYRSIIMALQSLSGSTARKRRGMTMGIG